MMVGKGDKRRPSFVDDDVFSSNWNRAFGSSRKQLRHRRGERLLYWSIVAILICLSAVVMRAASHYPVPESKPYVPKSDWRPPIKDCPKEVDLWACIRHAMYAKHI